MNLLFLLPRKLYYAKKKKALRNNAPTIISNDCFAGIAYHNLGLKFSSPTINLFLTKDDFISFLQNIHGFLNSEIKECERNERNYPIGELEYNSKKIKLHFLHYKTFDEAVTKWTQRKERIDFSNLYIIFTVSKDLTSENVEAFKNLPYPNKLLITYPNNEFQEEFIITHDIFKKENYQAGEFLRFRPPFFYKRYMDDIDYISFINSTNE